VKISLGLIISHGFPVPAAFVKSLALVQQALLTGDGNVYLPAGRKIDSVNLLWSHAFPVDSARNEIVRMFLDHSGSDYLLFLDTDMTHPPEIAHRLVAHDLDIVTARYTMRKPPFFSVAMRKVGGGPRDYQAIDKLEGRVAGLMPVDAGGAGALLLSRKLLTAMREAVGDDWFRYQVGPDGLRSVSEDMWCYEQARLLGFQPYLDADLVCGHVAQFEVDPKWHVPYQEALARAKQEVA
jgi:hypothetical protein